MRKLPGLRKFMPIVCKRGYIQDDTLWQLVPARRQRQEDRRNGSVVLLNEAHQAVIRWNF